MVKQLSYTLLSDGSSDRGLLPILTWLLRQRLPAAAIQQDWADLSRVRCPGQTLSDRIAVAIELYPCDLLFVHRDAERDPREHRVSEIRKALSESGTPAFPAVCVVPVRMTEAWLLFDEAAIRRASGNPNGKVRLHVSAPFDALPDPKQVLYDLLITASELKGRRRKKFRPAIAARSVPENIPDFAPLRQLAAFSALERDLLELVRQQGW